MQAKPASESHRLTAASVVVLLLPLVLAGCTSGSGGHPGRASQGNGATTTASSGSDGSSTGPAPTTATTAPVQSKTSAIVIPPNLCAATDIAQNTADAYMGALSAGSEAQALKCVFPNTVAPAVTHSLVAHVSGTAVYQPAGSNGPTVFGYKGNGKTVDVTVTREADGKTWVTRVVVH